MSPMILLRVLGVAIAVVLAIVAARGWRRRSLRLTDALIALALAGGLALVSLTPSVVDPVLRVLGFPPGNARRVIGVLVVSNILLFVLLLRAFAKTDRLEQVFGGYADRMATRWYELEYGRDGATGGKVAIVIPAYNEEASIADTLGVIPDVIHGLKVEPIVVSDGSSDTTERIAREHGAVVVFRDLRRGQGAAVALGYRVAVLRGAEIIATVDADGQYDPAELPQLIKPILDGEADVVHGSRVLGNYERPLFGRAQGLRVFARLTSLMTRTRITDPASGFRAFTSEAIRRLEFREDQFHASEVTVAAVKKRLRVKEVPCTFRERFAGSSKKPHVLRYGYGYARALLKTWLGPTSLL
jgi:hypothetical protein